MAIRFLRVTTLILFVMTAMQAWAAPPPACPTLSVGPLTTLPDAAVNNPYTASFDVTGSSTPYTWSITGGLPSGSGLSIAGTGTTATADLTGTPVKSGGFLLTVSATDSNGCNGGRIYSLNIPPDVVSTTPTNTATNVALNATVTINFSESVTAGAGAFSLECPSGTPAAFTMSASPAATYTLTPSAALPPGTICAAKVTAAQIASVSTGDAMPADYSFTFTTATQPAVVPPTTPADTATGVAVNTTISIPFNESVNAPAAAFTLACGAGTPTITATNSPNATINLTLSGPLPAGASCTVTALAAQITDASTSSSHPAADYPFSFTTVTAPAVVPPTTPVGGAIDVAVNTAISIPFNQSVNAPVAAFTLACGAGTPTIISSNSPSATIVLTLSGPLPAGAPCTLTALAAQITDAATSSSHMAANFPISFTTVTAPAVVPPTTPANAATNVAVNTAISIPFNESVNAAAAAFTLACGAGTPTISTTNSPNATITLTLSGPLPAGSSCTVTALAAQITDATTSSAHLASDFTFSFNTVTAPAVVPPTTPANGAVNVLANATISLPFNESVNAPAAAFTLACVPGLAPSVISTNSPGSTIALTLGGALPFGSTCTVTALKTQITDALTSSAHPAADFSFSFSTVTQPAVISTIPANSATNVLATTAISLTFNENVNASAAAFTLTCGAGTPTIVSTTSPGTTIALTLSGPLPGGASCTVTALAAQITDAATSSAHMASDFPFSFTVDSPPTVSSTVPTNGATGVLVNSTVSITFNKSVNVTGSAFTLECPTGSAIPFTVTPASPATTFVLHPVANLPAGVVCTTTVVATQVTDTVGTAMAANYVFSFSVPPVVQNDTYPETVIGNVSVNSATISFSVTTNDSCTTTCSITAFDATSANGGTVTMTTSGAGIGQFTYDPPAGYTGPTDTFTYTLGSAGGAATATVTMPISGVIWFVNSAAATNGNGRLSSPFNTLAAFQLVNDGAACLAANNPRCHPAANANIFLYESATDYVGPVTLLNGQKLIGQDATSTLSAITGLTPGPSSAPLPAMNLGNPITNVTAGGDAVRITTGSSNTIRGLTIGNVTAAGTGINMAAGATIFGTLTIGAPFGSQDVRFNTNGRAMNLQGGTLTANLVGITSTGGANNVNLTTIGGTSDFGGGAMSGASGTGFFMSAGTATITYGGTVAAGTQAPIVLQNRTGGTVTFTGAVTSATQGISLTANTGATTAFTGGINLSTGANAAFTATGGGTVTATQDNGAIVNTLATTTGTALNVANTTIGAAGLTFRSISAGTAGGSGGNGIVLDTTGASGGVFAIVGNGAAGSGGTIQHKTGSDGSTTSGIGIYLNNTRNVSFDRMALHDFDNFGILGTTVNGFTLSNCVINGTNGTLQGGIGEGDVYFTGLSGSASVTNSQFSGAAYDVFHVFNNSGETLNRITITNSTFAMTNTSGNDALVFQATNGTFNATVQSSTISAARSDLFQLNLLGTATSDLVFGGTSAALGNTLTNSNGNIVSGGGGITIGGGGPTNNVTLTYNIAHNSIKGSHGAVIALTKGTGVGASFVGTIDTNTIGVQGTFGSGSTQGEGIAVFQDGAGTSNTTITNNHVSGVVAGRGAIDVYVHNGAAGQMTAVVQGNTVDTLDQANSFAGMYLQTGSNTVSGGSPDNNKSCLTIGGAGALQNSIDLGANASFALVAGIAVEQEGTSRVGLLGSTNYAGTPYNFTAIQNYIAANNTGTFTNGQSTFAFGDSSQPAAGGFFGACPP